MGQVSPGAAEVPDDKVVAVEAVVLGPGVEQQVAITWTDERALPLEQLEINQPGRDARDAAGIETGLLPELLLPPPAPRLQQQDAGKPGALGRER